MLGGREPGAPELGPLPPQARSGLPSPGSKVWMLPFLVGLTYFISWGCSTQNPSCVQQTAHGGPIVCGAVCTWAALCGGLRGTTVTADDSS